MGKGRYTKQQKEAYYRWRETEDGQNAVARAGLKTWTRKLVALGFEPEVIVEMVQNVLSEATK